MGAHILVVDDNPADADLLQHACTECGLDVQLDHVPDAIAACARLSAVRPDLVLLDIKMPGEDGFDVLDWIRTRPELAGMPVVMMSSSTVPEDRQRALDGGVVRYWVKPARYEDLLRAVAGLPELLQPRAAEAWADPA